MMHQDDHVIHSESSINGSLTQQLGPSEMSLYSFISAEDLLCIRLEP